MAELDLSVDAGARFGISPSMLDAAGLREVQEILQEVVFSWREILQDAWPRDTGTSFAAWRSRVVGLDLEISNPVDYAEWVHAPGESVGSSGEFMEAALERLLSAASSPILQAVQNSVARIGSGLAERAEMIGAVPGIGGGIVAALARAFGRRSVRQRQRDKFGAPEVPQGGRRTVLVNSGGVLVRFRQRTRVR